MKKRTFIPPSHRPYVRGTEMVESKKVDSLRINNRSDRRKLILDLINDKINIPGVDNNAIRALFFEAFPSIGVDRVQTSA